MPKRNISKNLADIKKPSREAPDHAVVFVDNLKVSAAPEKTGPAIRQLGVIFCGIAVLIAFFAFDAFKSGAAALHSFTSVRKEASGLAASLKKFDTETAAETLHGTSGRLAPANEAINTSFSSLLANFLDNFLPGAKEVPAAFRDLKAVNDTAAAVADTLTALKQDGPQLMLGGQGQAFIALLEKLKTEIATLRSHNNELQTQSFRLKPLSADISSIVGSIQKYYFKTTSALYQSETVLDSLITLLDAGTPQHILLIFQNPGEIRPAGGFIGSFGYVSVKKGNLETITIDDIYNADRQFHGKIIPPRELQPLTKNWGARDANWFFDFPSSAEKVAGFLEQSDLFAASSTRFEAAIAINTNVLKTIIDAVGPVEIPTYQLVLDGDNFLKELQREVEAGRDHKPGHNPKKVLSAMAPLLLEKLKHATEDQKKALAAGIAGHLANKDIMLHFRNEDLQQLMENAGVAGEVMTLPEGFAGDYLAVANANLAGGKSDAFIRQTIVLDSILAANGTVSDALAVSRTHSGQDQPEWWYKAPNKNYIKILAPASAALTSIEGQSPQNRIPAYDYKNYVRDSGVEAVESRERYDAARNVWIGSESGKTTFGTRFTVTPGTTETLNASYAAKSNTDVRDGGHYRFVFEKQSGASTSLAYSIKAPEGFVWQETNAPLFEYRTENPRAREIIDLTLAVVPTR